MRTLAIETSSRRGTVSLVEGGQAVVTQEHTTPNAHGEALLRLLDAACANAGWARSTFDQVAVGIGPGSFTGLRVGIAFAQGVAIGLDRPVRGVGSLRAMAEGASEPGLAGLSTALRCAVVDARRDEVFLAVYDASGTERLSPRALGPQAACVALSALDADLILVGEGATLLLGQPALGARRRVSPLRGPLTDLPHAACVGRIAEERGVAGDTEPLYIRPADAIRPHLPPSPLSSGRVEP